MNEILYDFCRISRQECGRVLDTLDEAFYREAVDLVHHAQQRGGRLHITGIGKPAHVAAYGEYTFTKRENLETVSKQFHDKAKAAAEFFQEPNAFRCTETEIQEHLERCLTMSNASKDEFSLEEILRAIPPLVLGILLQHFHKLATDCDAVSMHRFVTSTTYA